MNRIISFILAFVFAQTLFAQEFEIDEAARALNGGTYHSFHFELPDVSKKDAETQWKKFMDDFKAKSKFDRKTSIWFSDNAKIPQLSDNTVDVYASIIEDSNPNKRTSVIAWFDLGGAYVNPETHPTQTAYTRAMLTEYAMSTSRSHAMAILKGQEKTLKDFQSELSSLEKDNSNYRKELEKAKALIAKLNKDIEINELDQKKMKESIEKQRESVAEAQKSVKVFN